MAVREEPKRAARCALSPTPPTDIESSEGETTDPKAFYVSDFPRNKGCLFHFEGLVKLERCRKSCKRIARERHDREPVRGTETKSNKDSPMSSSCDSCDTEPPDAPVGQQLAHSPSLLVHKACWVPT